MKRWQVEEILYLNDIDKRKLAVAEAPLYSQYEPYNVSKKEFFLLPLFRNIATILLKIL